MSEEKEKKFTESNIIDAFEGGKRIGYNQALKDAQEQCRKEFMDDRWEIIPTLFLIRTHCVGCIKGLEKQEGK